MALYIHPENQTILWNALSSSPLFSAFNTLPKRKEDWFRDIIQFFYNNSKKEINSNELQILNRDTIAYMINIMKAYHKNNNTLHLYNKPPLLNVANSFISVNNNQNLGRTGDMGSIATRSLISDQKEQFISREFNERQLEYESMLVKDPPKNVDFQTISIDEPISNMDELIKQHMLDRESELIQYAPPPINNNNIIPILKIDNVNDDTLLTNVIEIRKNLCAPEGSSSILSEFKPTNNLQRDKIYDTPNSLKKAVHWDENPPTSSHLIDIIHELREECYNYREEMNNTIIILKLQIDRLTKCIFDE